MSWSSCCQLVSASAGRDSGKRPPSPEPCNLLKQSARAPKLLFGTSSALHTSSRDPPVLFPELLGQPLKSSRKGSPGASNTVHGYLNSARHQFNHLQAAMPRTDGMLCVFNLHVCAWLSSSPKSLSATTWFQSSCAEPLGATWCRP